mmetsp:Transcript_3658/g.8329  ORF Transcript_3658/g.8329 Transcript_3658/m.8329 type:complete len:271 (+) Transcript_3658:1249-2061(+)
MAEPAVPVLLLIRVTASLPLDIASARRSNILPTTRISPPTTTTTTTAKRNHMPVPMGKLPTNTTTTLISISRCIKHTVEGLLQAAGAGGSANWITHTSRGQAGVATRVIYEAIISSIELTRVPCPSVSFTPIAERLFSTTGGKQRQNWFSSARTVFRPKNGRNAPDGKPDALHTHRPSVQNTDTQGPDIGVTNCVLGGKLSAYNGKLLFCNGKLGSSMRKVSTCTGNLRQILKTGRWNGKLRWKTGVPMQFSLLCAWFDQEMCAAGSKVS